MLKLLVAPALLIAALTVPFGVAAQETQIIVYAPEGLDDRTERQWQKLEKRSAKLTKSLAESESRALDARKDLAKAEKRLADAEEKVREERRDLGKRTDRIAKDREDLASLEASMVEMGGIRRSVLQQ